ncbi:MAG: hypothetical protein RR646_05820 [Erysipelotrichaceae bacterium]
MNKSLIALMSGIAIGILVGYKNEDEIECLAHKSQRYQRKVMRKINHLADNMD